MGYDAPLPCEKGGLAIRILPADGLDDDGLIVEKLFEFQYLPVCSPSLLEANGPVKTPKDLMQLPVIHDEAHDGSLKTKYWKAWYKDMGVARPKIGPGIRFNSADPALNAAMDGAGVVLAANILAYDALKSGRLFAPFAHVISSGSAFNLVYPKQSARRPALAAFADWISNEVAQLDRNVLGGSSCQ